MTDPNIYGVSAEVEYSFADWTWEDSYPGLVARISREAAGTVLKEMAKDSHIWLDSDDAGEPIVEFSCFDGQASFNVPLMKVIDKWVKSRSFSDETIHHDDAQPLLTVLEAAVARIRAALR